MKDTIRYVEHIDNFSFLEELSLNYNIAIITADQSIKKDRFCKNCKHSDVNFWGYTECWKFNKELDHRVTFNTAEREKTASVLNTNKRCYYYSEKRKFHIFLNLIKKFFSFKK